MEEHQVLPDAEQKEKRPSLLTLLCILTFIGSGMNAFSNVVVFLFYDASMKLTEEVVKTFKIAGMDAFLTAKPVYFAVTALINVLAVTGAIRMWQLRKLGFHIYTVAQILVVIAPMYFFHLPGPDLVGVILSGIFVLLYSSYLKKMT